MPRGQAWDDLGTAISHVCRAGLDLDGLREAVLPRLRRAVPFDAVWGAAVDPATVLFTRTFGEGLPENSGPYFVENEYLSQDVNKWTELAQTPARVDTLMHATTSNPNLSGRYRDFFEPLGLCDELRAVLRSGGRCWGLICLHRDKAETPFSRDEARFVQGIAPHVAEGLRLGLVRQACDRTGSSAGPGLILLTRDGILSGSNQAADWWLEELGGRPGVSGLPVQISVLRTLLLRKDLAEPAPPSLRIQTKSGRWAILHASWTATAGEPVMAVIVEEASPAELAPMIMAAYALTERERTVTGLVCQGKSTRQMADLLHVTTDTIQDHLKSVFTRTGVHSRGDLVATILRHEYIPRATAGDPISPSGAFAAP